METEPEFDQDLPPQSDSISPTEDANHLPKLKRLKKKSHSMETNFDDTNSNSSPLNESDELEKVSEWDHDDDDDDGLDPLFGDANQFSAKRVLEFDDNESGSSQNDADFELGSGQSYKNKKKRTRVSAKKQELKIKEKTNNEKSAIQKDKKERQAQIAQHADYQRVMRERKGVGFKPTPMVEKSISSVLEKIRQRKLELSRKMMSSRSVEQTGFDNVSETSTSVAQMIMTTEDDKPGTGDEQTRCEYAGEMNTDAAPLDTTHEDKPETRDEQTNSTDVPLVDETTQSFRAPINDTQDLLLDSERSFSQGDELNESSFPVEDIAPSAPSLNLKFDSALPDDDISSDEEESDKENIEPVPKHEEFRGRSTTTGDPVKAFVDEEALEDDSDNDLLHSQDKDDEDDSDIEENCDYIATDFKEKQTDREKINQLHQQWDQQQDETRTKNLLQKLKYGTKCEPSLLDEDDDDDDKNSAEKENAEGTEVEEDEDDESDNDVLHVPATRPTTKKLKAMIPQMFTDEDDGFVSSEDEETEKRLSKQCLLQKVELEQQTKFLSPAEDETSREVFCRIKKLNVIPETKKKAKASSFFDALLTKGSSTNSSKSSFLRRASTHPGALSHRQGSSTGKTFIFGRDDSNSRSSMSLLEDSPNLGQKENQAKKNSSAKFTGSQAKWSTQRTETTSSTSLFDILKRSSVQTGFDDTRDNLADQQAVFAAFKSVKKQVKIERRSYQGP